MDNCTDMIAAQPSPGVRPYVSEGVSRQWREGTATRRARALDARLVIKAEAEWASACKCRAMPWRFSSTETHA